MRLEYLTIMGKSGKNKINKGTPKEEFPPLEVYLENPDERGYVRIPVEEVTGKPPRLCIIIGPRKTWETNIQALTKQLDIKRKDPIDFRDKGKCWAFYFDEDAGTLYNEHDDPKPILELCPAPKKEYIYAKTEESSKPAFTVNSQMNNCSVPSERRKQEKLEYNNTSLGKKENTQRIITTGEKGNELPKKKLPFVSKKMAIISDSNTPNIKGQNKNIADTQKKIEKALVKQQEVNPGDLFRSGKEYEKNGEFDKAIQAYRAAADAGFNQAGYKLGKLLMKLATDIFRQIAGLGHAGAQRELENLGKGNTDSQALKKTDKETATLQDLGSKGKPKDVKETPSAPVKKETERKGAEGLTEEILSNSATCIGETSKPLHEQKAYLEAIVNLIARYQLAKFLSEQESAHQAEKLLKKTSKESTECQHTISLTCSSDVTEPVSCSGEDVPSNPTIVNFFPVDEPQVIIQELVRYVNYWTGNDCLPELMLVDRQEPVSCESPLQSGHGFSAEPIIRQADFAEISAREEETSRNEADVTSDVPTKDNVCELSWRHIFTLIIRKLFSIFRK